MSTIKSQRSTAPSKDAFHGSQVLWKKINNNPKFQQATTVSSHTKKQSQSIKSQTNINKFLQMLHHRIPESMNHSESQIMEKESIDWSEDLGKPLASRESINWEADDQKLGCSQRALRCSCSLDILAHMKSIEEFLVFIQNINATLFCQISQIIDSNVNLELECEKLKNKIQAVEADNQLLRGHLQMMQSNSLKLCSDLSTLKKQVSIQIGAGDERAKSKSIKSRSTVSQQNSWNGVGDHLHDFVNQTGELKRCGKLTRSRGHNQRSCNFSSGAKPRFKAEQEQAKYIGGAKAGENYDKIIHQILKQDGKQLRNIKLFTNI